MKNLARDQSASKTDTGSRIVCGSPWLYGPPRLGPRDLRAFKVGCVFLLVLMTMVGFTLLNLVAALLDIDRPWSWLAVCAGAVLDLGVSVLLLRWVLRLRPATDAATDPGTAPPVQPEVSLSNDGGPGVLKMLLLCTPAFAAGSALLFLENTFIAFLVGIAGILVSSALCWFFRDKSYVGPVE